MSKFKVFIFFIFCIIANTVIAQTSIDTIGFKVNYPESYLRPYIRAGYIEGLDTSLFDHEDLSNYTFTWAGDSAPELDSLHFAIYEFKDTGKYNIDLTVLEKSSGTTFNFSKMISVRSFIKLKIPNVFTPNGDDYNNLFTVFFDGNAELEITIFSKTGTKVFSQKSPTIVWDGRNSSGSEVSEGIYYYILSSNDPRIEVHKGFVHLYRTLE